MLKSLIKLLTERKEEPIVITEKSEEFKNPKNILLLRQDRIGDVLISIPFVKKLREICPNANIEVVLSHRNFNIGSAINNYTDGVYILKKGIMGYFKLLKQLRSNNYNIVIDMLDNASTTSSILIRYTKSDIKFGFKKKNKKIYTHVVELPDKTKYQITERLNSLLIPFQGTDDNNEKITYELSDEIIDEAKRILGNKTKRIRLGINLAGSNKSKNWGTGNYIAFIKMLKSMLPNVEIIAFTTKKNKKQLSEIEASYPDIAAPLVKSFDLFAAMIKTCDVILTPDTSVVHLCSAFDIPCLALFTYSDNTNVGLPWEPQSKHSKILKISENKSLGLIKVTDVLAALKQIIEEIND